MYNATHPYSYSIFHIAFSHSDTSWTALFRCTIESISVYIQGFINSYDRENPGLNPGSWCMLYGEHLHLKCCTASTASFCLRSSYWTLFRKYENVVISELARAKRIPSHFYYLGWVKASDSSWPREKIQAETHCENNKRFLSVEDNQCVRHRLCRLDKHKLTIQSCWNKSPCCTSPFPGHLLCFYLHDWLLLWDEAHRAGLCCLSVLYICSQPQTGNHASSHCCLSVHLDLRNTHRPVLPPPCFSVACLRVLPQWPGTDVEQSPVCFFSCTSQCTTVSRILMYTQPLTHFAPL